MSDLRDSEPGAPEHAKAVASTPSIERRRALFKGLLGGAAAAGVPLKAHANYSGKFCDKTPDGKKCRRAEASTFGSVISLANGNDKECKGYKREHYCVSSNWPSNCNQGGHWSSYTTGGVITKDTRFCRAFNISSTSTGKKDMTLWALCNDTTSSDERTYAIAFANANKLFGNVAPNAIFPYDPASVVNLYKGALKAQGATLFTTYLSAMA